MRADANVELMQDGALLDAIRQQLDALAKVRNDSKKLIKDRLRKPP